MPLPIVKKQSLLLRLIHAVLLRVSPYALISWYVQVSDMFLSLANLLITRQHKGVHPKHRIMRYEEFFLRYVSEQTSVLDVGSGPGVVAGKLAAKARHVTGLEIDPGVCEFARRNNKAENLIFIQGDATRFKPAENFDVAVLSNVLEHVDDRVGLLRALRGYCRMLLVRVPALDRDWWPMYRRELGVEWRSDPTHYTEHTESELRDELQAAGWHVECLERRWGEYYVKCQVEPPALARVGLDHAPPA